MNQGLIFFILNSIFDKSRPVNDRIEFMRIILHTALYTEKIYSSFIPDKFFYEYFYVHRDVYQGILLHTGILYTSTPATLELITTEREKMRSFIEGQLDQIYYENVFVIWNEEIRNRSQQRIMNNC